MERDEWLERVASIKSCKRGGERAPHKPLLLLYAALHHKLFDRGVLGVSDSLTVEVSPEFAGHGAAALAVVMDLLGREVLAPHDGLESPSTDHLSWHRTEVFHGPQRSVA